jgi:predicted DNA-binding transcriptional regulator
MPIEVSEISLDEVLVYRALCQSRGRWVSERQLAQQIQGITVRSVRTQCLRLAKRGLVEQPSVFPMHRYRFSAAATRPDHPYVRRLEHAAVAFGLATAPAESFV